MEHYSEGTAFMLLEPCRYRLPNERKFRVATRVIGLADANPPRPDHILLVHEDCTQRVLHYDAKVVYDNFF